jgi:Aldo/keto reductase family
VTERVVLVSKGRFGGGQEVNAAGLSRASDMHTPVEETLSFLDGAVKAGKIHYIGLSNFTGGSSNSSSPRRRQWACRFL